MKKQNINRIVGTFLTMLSLILICSCVQQGNRQQDEPQEEEVQLLPIESFVFDFLSRHPNYHQNDLTREAADVEFKQELLDSLLTNRKFFEGFPMTHDGMNRHNGKIVAHFSSWGSKPYDWKYNDSISSINTDLFGIVSEEMASRLTNHEHYIVYGKLIKTLTMKDLPKYFGQRTSLYTPDYRIEKPYSRYDVQMGVLWYQIDSIAEFEGRD